MKEIIKQVSTIHGMVYVPVDDPEHAFGRVVGGIAWPAHGNPGFICVLAEDLHDDMTFKERHIHRVFEARTLDGAALVHMENLLYAAVQVAQACQVSRWFAPRLEHATPLVRFNRSQAQIRQPQIRPVQPTHNPDFEYYASLLRPKMHERKTLHFGKSKIPSRIMALPNDCSGEYFADHPEVTALLFAVAGLELMHSGMNTNPKNKGYVAADRAGGY